MRRFAPPLPTGTGLEFLGKAALGERGDRAAVGEGSPIPRAPLKQPTYHYGPDAWPIKALPYRLTGLLPRRPSQTVGFLPGVNVANDFP
jgi:hypothetical protein